MDVRVRLVFADDVGRHLHRRRGFSSCWYLIPKDAKLVGDLAHALLQEFELWKCCPNGLVLLLEELPVLATQSARIIRDNDTIIVQCPSLENELVSACETDSSESGVETFKRKAHGKTKDEQNKKKSKTTDVMKKRNEYQQLTPKSRERCGEKTHSGLKKRTLSASSEESSSSSSSSSSTSSSSSSSSSESEEDVDSVAQSRKRVVETATRKKQQPESLATSVNAVSNGVPSEIKATSQQSEKEPRRRRRRLRQRNGGRQRNRNQSHTSDCPANSGPSPGNPSQVRDQAATASQHSRRTSSTEIQYSGCVRGYPRAKQHVYFDPVTGDGLEVEHNELQNDANAVRSMKHDQISDLAKYGPSSDQISRDNPDRRVFSSTELANGDERVSNTNESFERKDKRKYEERWKRPYKIVATVHDNKSGKLSNTSVFNENQTLTKLLDSYPTTSITLSSQFVPKDVIAYKTLTLCLETWEPVLSQWQCGEVQSTDVSGNAVEVSICTLEANGDSVNFNEVLNAERQSIQVNEISELRFLTGPSWLSLQNSKQNASSTTVEAMG